MTSVTCNISVAIMHGDFRELYISLQTNICGLEVHVFSEGVFLPPVADSAAPKKFIELIR